MNFQGLRKIDTASQYMDLAYLRAKKAVANQRGSTKGTRLEKSRKLEMARLDSIAKSLKTSLGAIIVSYPSLDDLPEFYIELIKCYYPLKDLKRSLGAINWVIDNTAKFTGRYRAKIKRCNEMSLIGSFRREYFGRVSSMLKQIGKDLILLEKARLTLKGFPSVKQKLFTVAIAGFPNVGKTTLMKKLTKSSSGIAPYAFTTKGLKVGYFEHNHQKIQLIDTPGTLNREKQNPIETMAHLAMKYCAATIIYIFDLTESYPIEDQKELYRRIKKLGKPMIVYFSKTDVNDFDLAPYENYLPYTESDLVKKQIISLRKSL